MLANRSGGRGERKAAKEDFQAKPLTSNSPARSVGPRRVISTLGVVALLSIIAITADAFTGSDVIVKDKTIAEPTSPGGHVLFEPPDDGPPGVTREEALDLAKQEAPGLFQEADAIEIQLVRFTDLNARGISDVDGREGPLIHEKVLAWVVTLRGVCFPVMGRVFATPPPTPPPTCAGTEMNLVLDASTGEFIEGFSYR